MLKTTNSLPQLKRLVAWRTDFYLYKALLSSPQVM
jgi:hypothetical protein